MGNTNVMKSASVIALSRIIYQYKNRPVVQSLLPQIITIILALFQVQVKEITKSCLGFIKILTSILTPLQLESYSEKIIQAIFTNYCKQKFRNNIKVIVERLIRKIGYDKVEPYIPIEDKKVITNMKKSLDKSSQNKKEKMEEDDNDSSGEDEIDDWFQNLSKDYKISSIRDNGNEPIDLLSTRQVLTTNKSIKRKRDYNDVYKFILQNIEYTKDGKLLLGGQNNDKKESDDDDDINENNIKPKKKLVIKKSVKQEIKGQKVGEEYKAKKAKGDVVLKGKPQPFSYVKLDSRDISKKGRKFAIDKYKKVVVKTHTKGSKKEEESRKKRKVN